MTNGIPTLATIGGGVSRDELLAQVQQAIGANIALGRFAPRPVTFDRFAGLRRSGGDNPLLRSADPIVGERDAGGMPAGLISDDPPAFAGDGNIPAGLSDLLGGGLGAAGGSTGSPADPGAAGLRDLPTCCRPCLPRTTYRQTTASSSPGGNSAQALPFNSRRKAVIILQTSNTQVIINFRPIPASAQNGFVALDFRERFEMTEDDYGALVQSELHVINAGGVGGTTDFTEVYYLS